MQLTEVIICKALCFELKQGKEEWEMARKACNIPLFMNLGFYEGLDNVKSYSVPQGSQSFT